MKQTAESLIFNIYMDPLLTISWLMSLVKVVTVAVTWRTKPCLMKEPTSQIKLFHSPRYVYLIVIKYVSIIN